MYFVLTQTSLNTPYHLSPSRLSTSSSNIRIGSLCTIPSISPLVPSTPTLASLSSPPSPLASRSHLLYASSTTAVHGTIFWRNSNGPIASIASIALSAYDPTTKISDRSHLSPLRPSLSRSNYRPPHVFAVVGASLVCSSAVERPDISHRIHLLSLSSRIPPRSRPLRTSMVVAIHTLSSGIRSSARDTSITPFASAAMRLPTHSHAYRLRIRLIAAPHPRSLPPTPRSHTHTHAHPIVFDIISPRISKRRSPRNRSRRSVHARTSANDAYLEREHLASCSRPCTH